MEKMGAVSAVIEHQDLHTEFAAGYVFDKVLNLVGNSVLLESMNFTRVGGIMLQAGWLGGLDRTRL